MNRLHIARDRDHWNYLNKLFPDDLVITPNTMTRGNRFDAVLVWPQKLRSATEYERFSKWMQYEVETCLMPDGLIHFV